MNPLKPVKLSTLSAIFGSLLCLTPFASYAADLDMPLYPLSTTITNAQSTIIQQNILNKEYKGAISYINEELKRSPNNIALLFKKAGLQADIEQYDKCIDTLDEILVLQPKNSDAIKLKEQIQLLVVDQPKNEIGIYGDIASVSNVNSYWQFGSIHYYRTTKYGIYGARVNYSKRNGNAGEQYQLEAYPKFSNPLNIQYIYVSFAYANFNQIVFPNYQVTLEPYFTLPANFELSVGFRGLRSLNNNIYTYTGSLAYYFGNNYAWFRPYHYTPKSSDFFEIGIRHYFSDNNTYISVKGGIGKAPDILDLAPLNQIIVLDQDLLAILGQFPLQKNIYLQAGAGYLHQVFPSESVRNIVDGSLQLIWQF